MGDILSSLKELVEALRKITKGRPPPPFVA